MFCSTTKHSKHHPVALWVLWEEGGSFYIVDYNFWFEQISTNVSLWHLDQCGENKQAVQLFAWLDYSVSKALKTVSIWSYLIWLHVFEFSSQLHRKPLNTASALWICPCFTYSSNRRHYWEIIYAWNTKLCYRFVLTSYFGTVLCYNRSDIIYTICDAVMKQFNTDKCPHSQAVCRHNDLRVIFLIWFFGNIVRYWWVELS